MDQLVFEFPARLFFGPEALAVSVPYLASRAHRYLIITESVLKPLAGEVKSTLVRHGLNTIVYDEIPSGADIKAMQNVAELAKASHAELVVGLGGIKTLSAARFAASALAKKGERLLPLVLIPTTCRDPFLFTGLSYVRNNRDASRIRGVADASPVAVVVDPAYAMGLPPKSSATVALAAILDAVDTMISDRATFLSRTYAESAIRTLSETIPGLIGNPGVYRFREESASGGVLSAMSVRLTAPGPGMALAFSLSSRYRVPKSWVAALLLPHLLDVYAESFPDAIARVAAALGERTADRKPADAARSASDAVRSLLGHLSLEMRLRGFDLAPDDLRDAAEDVLSFPFLEHYSLEYSGKDYYGVLMQAY